MHAVRDILVELLLLLLLGFELRAINLEPPHQPFFVLSIFKIESQELFAQASFEL
jgi:hypothetical protein